MSSYRDDPSSASAEEAPPPPRPSYRDDPSSAAPSAGGEDDFFGAVGGGGGGDDAPRVGKKVLFATLLLLALSSLGGRARSSGSGGGGGGDSRGRSSPFPAAGVRGKPEPSDVAPHATAEPPPLPNSSIPSSERDRPVVPPAAKSEQQRLPTTHLPRPPSSLDACEDDPDLVLDDEKHHTCFTFVAHIGRPALHEAKCNRPSGMRDERGEEVLIKQYCRYSCGVCGDGPWATKATEGGEQPEAEAKGKGPAEGADHEVETGDQEEEEEFIEAASQFDGEGGEPTEITPQEQEGDTEPQKKETEEDKAETAESDLGASDSTGNEASSEGAAKVDPGPSEDESSVAAQEPTVSTEGDGEDPGSNVVEGGASGKGAEPVNDGLAEGGSSVPAKENNVSAEGVGEGPDDEETAENGPSGDESSVPATQANASVEGSPEEDLGEAPFDPPPDYFVPLTEAERASMKQRLHGVLWDTRDSLLLASKLADLPVSVLPYQRTLALKPGLARQFVHLVHDGAGGATEGGVDALVACAADRQDALHGEKAGTAIVGRVSLVEGDNLRRCLDELAKAHGAVSIGREFYLVDEGGHPTRAKLDDVPAAARDACGAGRFGIATFGASLADVRSFGWKGVDSISVFADPADRAFRAYRRAADRCYGCRSMKDALRDVAGGTFGRSEGEGPVDGSYDPDDSCVAQMMGHQGTNLLSSPELYRLANDASFPSEVEIVREAVRNLREEITWIGIADDVEASVAGFRAVFPWLSEDLNGAAERLRRQFEKGGEEVDDAALGLPDGYVDARGCAFRKRAEDRYICGTRELDEETLAWI
ncbi:hypothetical protein ACHAWF_006741, partial [Thalassiosira exigua]